MPRRTTTTTRRRAATQETETPILDAVAAAPNPATLTATFGLNSLNLKSMVWTMQMKVNALLDKSFHKYEARFIFDERPYQDKLATIEHRMTEIRNDNQLFGNDNRINGINTLAAEAEQINRQREERKLQCPGFVVPIEIQELKYTNAGTMLKVIVPDTSIELFNKYKFYFNQYAVELEPRE